MKPTENYSNDQLFNLHRDIESVGSVKRMIRNANLSFSRNWEIPERLKETFSEYKDLQNLKVQEMREQEAEFQRWMGHNFVKKGKE